MKARATGINVREKVLKDSNVLYVFSHHKFLIDFMASSIVSARNDLLFISGISSFSQTPAWDEVCMALHIQSWGICTYMHRLSSKWNRLAVCPCYCWVTDCGAKCPKHSFSPQITCEFLNDRLLPHYWLSVCTRFGGIHLKAIQRCCMRQEVSALAHRIIHSVSRTQRGLSSLVSLLLAFKECVCAQCTCENVRVCVLMHAYVPVGT